MKLVIISDVHDNQVNLKTCLNWCQEKKIKSLLCCGDLANFDTLSFLSSGFDGDIYLVRGNADLYEESSVLDFKNINYFSSSGFIKFAELNIGFCHEPFKINEIKNKDICDYIFYGHTHKPDIKEEGNLQLANPGTLAGLFTRATFACLDGEKNKLELIII